MANDLCTTGEAARILQVHPDTVVRWADAGKIPVLRMPSGQRRFRRTDIEALLVPSDAERVAATQAEAVKR